MILKSPTPTRFAIYVRISRDRVGAGLGVDRQVEDCKALSINSAAQQS
jgi:hypothetical protein